MNFKTSFYLSANLSRYTQNYVIFSTLHMNLLLKYLVSVFIARSTKNKSKKRILNMKQNTCAES